MPWWLPSHHLVRHFLRGYVDGYGNFYFSTKGREFRLIGTVDFLIDVNKLLIETLSIPNLPIIETTDNLGKIRCHDTTIIKKIGHYLYHDSSRAILTKKESALK